MKMNKLIGSGIALVLIIVLIVGLNMFSEKRAGKKEAFFPAFSAKTCSQFIITADNDVVRLFKENATWKASDKLEDTQSGSAIGDEVTTDISDKSGFYPYPADSSAVRNALRKIGEMEKEMLMSTNPEKRDKFKVDSTNGLLLEVFDENRESMGSVVIGKSGPAMGSHYVRMLGSDNVYSVSGNIRNAFHTSPKRWCDKTIISFDAARAEKIELINRMQKTALAKRDTVIDSAATTRWHLTSPKKAAADQGKVSGIVTALSDFTCSSWETSALSMADMGLDKPQLVARVTLNTGTTKEIIIGNQKKKSKNFFVKLPQKETAFLVAKKDIDKLDKNFDDLVKESKQ